VRSSRPLILALKRSSSSSLARLVSLALVFLSRLDSLPFLREEARLESVEEVLERTLFSVALLERRMEDLTDG